MSNEIHKINHRERREDDLTLRDLSAELKRTNDELGEWFEVTL